MTVHPLPVPDPDPRRGEEWEEPMPLAGSRELPAFPLETLPDWLAAYASAIATETQTPPDLAGCLGLAALSTAAARRGRVAVRGTWTEPLNIMAIVGMPAGSRKSPVFSAMTRPLAELEMKLAEQTQPVIDNAKIEQEIARDRAQKLRKQASNNDGAHRETLGMAQDAAAQAEAVAVPKPPRLIAGDVTPEVAATLMHDNGGRIALLSAEGGIISILAGRYSGMANYDFVLSGHAGQEPLRVDRRDRAEHVDQPAVTFGLAVQPTILAELGQVPAARDKGLHARFLFSLPEDLVGRRKIGPPPVPATLANAYNAHLTALANELYARHDQPPIPLDADAATRVLDLETETEPRLAPGGQWAPARDWFSKWVGSICRLAGLLHLGDHGTNGLHHPIDANTLDRATQLGRYYADHALAVYDLMGTNQTLADARALLDWITRKQLDQFTQRDAYRNHTSRFNNPTDLPPVLDVLEEHGHIQQIDNTQADGKPRRGRPPSPTYAVHPTHRTKDTNR